MHPDTIHDHALFTIDQITRKFKLDAVERGHLLKKLDGKAATVDEHGRVLYRWIDVVKALNPEEKRTD